MKVVKIIYDNESVGLGSTIFRGLHKLYYKKPEEIFYFKFNNNLYSNNKNTWNQYLHQPFEQEREFIEEEYRNGRSLIEYGFRDNNKFIFCYGRDQDNGNEFKNKIKVQRYRELFNKYIKFKLDIEKKADNFYNKEIKGRKTISIHCRGTDQYTEYGHAGNNRELLNFQFINNVLKSKDFDFIFLATDEEETLNKFKNFYGDKIITYSTIRCKKDSKLGIHFTFTNEKDEKKYLIGEEALVDSILMSRCDSSLYVRSNISLLSLLLRKDFNYEFYDDHIIYDNLG